MIVLSRIQILLSSLFCYIFNFQLSPIKEAHLYLAVKKFKRTKYEVLAELPEAKTGLNKSWPRKRNHSMNIFS